MALNNNRSDEEAREPSKPLLSDKAQYIIGALISVVMVTIYLIVIA